MSTDTTLTSYYTRQTQGADHLIPHSTQLHWAGYSAKALAAKQGSCLG